MDPEYGARYRDLYQRHWWWRAREELVIRVLRRHVDPQDEGEVLDFGCGDGLFLSALQQFGCPTGIEVNSELLDPRGEWRDRIDTRPLAPDPNEAGRFRLVVALDVLEHIPDPIPVVQELGRRLVPGGWFLATVPAFQALWTSHDDLNHHERRYRLSELQELLRQGGLSPVQSGYFFSWLAVPKWILARVEGVLRPSPRLPQIPPTLVNSAALAVSRLEQRLLPGLSAPFGSSALVMARKG